MPFRVRIDTKLRMQQGLKKWGSLLLIFFINHPVYPQLLDVTLSNNPEQLYNKKFVADNKIKKITASVASKPDNDIVKDIGLTHGHEFDSTGNATKIYTAYLNNNGTSDTVATRFFYDKNFNMILKRSNNGAFYNSYYYEYYDDKKAKKEVHCRETNSNLEAAGFKLGVQLVLSQESFRYDSLTPTQFKKICLNDEGRLYKQGIINKDSLGRIVEESYSYAVGWVKNVNNYKYNNSGRISERINRSNENGDVNERTTYEYDVSGNLITEKRYKNEIQTQEMSYLYDDQKKLLKSLVTRYHLEKRIGIVKYSYEFYQ